MFGPEVEAAFIEYAREQYPKEACGFVQNGAFVPKANVAANPFKTFEIAGSEYPLDGSLQAVLHSHPDGRLVPSFSDIEGQVDSDVPWGLITVSLDRVSSVLYWGPGVTVPPLLGRKFRSGPSGSDGRGDCYALIRDYYRLELGIELKEYPRDEESFVQGQNLYVDNFADCGWVQITERELQPGDVFLMQVRAKVPNHGGIYLGQGLGLHHLMDKLSRREGLAIYKKFITHYLRYEG